MTLAIAAAITIVVALVVIVVVACIQVRRDTIHTSSDPNVIEVPGEAWDGFEVHSPQITQKDVRDHG